jgi:hypothetical protein
MIQGSADAPVLPTSTEGMIAADKGPMTRTTCLINTQRPLKAASDNDLCRSPAVDLDVGTKPD